MTTFNSNEIAEALGAKIVRHGKHGFYSENSKFFFCPMGRLYICKENDTFPPRDKAIATVEYGDTALDIDWHTLYKYYGGPEQLTL